MIIDMHTHCFPDPLAKKAMPMLAMRSGNPYPAFDGTASGLRESVISGGADRAAVLNIATNAQTQANQASQAAGQAMSTAISSTGKLITQGYEAWSKANEGSTT